MAVLTIEVSGRHARTRPITRDTVSPANRPDPRALEASRDVARVVSGCVRFVSAWRSLDRQRLRLRPQQKEPGAHPTGLQ
jgi:hypothetical protein